MAELKKKQVLIIDDDAKLASFLAKFVEKYGYSLHHAGTATAGIKEIERLKPDVVLLDVNLGADSGLDLCREIRTRNSVPIIMISGLGESSDRVLGLQVGADSYLPKPFEPRELVAQLEAILRRVEKLSNPSKDGSIELGELKVDFSKREAYVSGKSLTLSSAEFDVLTIFVSMPGHVFTRDELLNRLKGIDWDAYNRSVDIIVSRLRKKLGDTSKEPKFIKTVWGTGYVFIPQSAERKAG